MINQQLIDWIKGYLDAGYTYEQLNDYLLSQGYTQTDVNESFQRAFAAEHQVQQPRGFPQTQTQTDQTIPQTEVQQARPLNSNENIKQTNNNAYPDFYPKNNAQSPKKSRKKMIIIIVAIVVFLLIVGATAFFIYTRLVLMPGLHFDEGEQPGTVMCDTRDCFTDKFSRCEKASVNQEVLAGLTYHYEILGVENGYCKVKSYYTHHPNVDWIYKEMTCLYSNKIHFDEAERDNTNCQGPLYDLMNQGEEMTI